MAKAHLVLFFVLFVLANISVSGQSGKFKRVQRHIDKATQKGGLVGVSVLIHDPEWGKWIGVSGFANLEKEVLLEKDHIFALGSIGKLYNAVAAMKLAEDQRLQLDDSISRYLDPYIITHLPNAREVTIRNLLAHTTGYINYDRDSELNRLYLEGKLMLDTISKLEVLERYVFDKEAMSKPGEEYHYSSTNYLLLAMIMDAVVPQGHTAYLRNMLKQYGFSSTFYRQTPPDKMVQHYGDINQDGISENLTAQTIETTNWFEGDDGIYATIEEASRFLEDLLTTKIVNEESLRQMTTWNDGKHPDYGLGLIADKRFLYKFLIGSGGRGIGMTTDLYYFPKQKRTVSIFCNSGLRAAAPEFRRTYLKMRRKIVKTLF